MSLLRRAASSFPQLPGFAIRCFKSLNLSGESLDSSSSLTHGIHAFQCPDVVGIVAKLSECIASRGGNILGADIFVPENKNVFYSRSSEFLFDPVKWPRLQMDKDFLNLSKVFNAMKSVVRVPALDPKYKIAVLASKQTCHHVLAGSLSGRLVTWMAEWKTSSGHNLCDKILSGNFLSTYGKDVINIHHGLLPSFKGGNPSKQAFDAGVKLIGATSHFVTEELDAGPIIEQMVERVSHRDNLLSFVQKLENLEKQCLAKAIKSYCELRVLPYKQNRTVVF
ncbi:formyltetrahydrofolate deformylase 2, mitochondrial isoform X11 [Malania oleifera]|uniref:formyltetrahydrofolate deformylase 2, mitochondrial isoform X11 n=1 Tax=Malania oleifera TaxID=397392 RepID=UPI0025AE1EE8|nr:formyltetrahydrofolate deformylase 2, mitochondrial isoform X11 [Malania oleifera]